VTQRRLGLLLLLVVSVLALACTPPVFWAPTVTPPVVAPPVDSATALPATAAPATAPPAPTEIETALPAATATAVPTPAPEPTLTPAPVPATDPRLSPGDVQIFPWPLYEGDTISMDVTPDLAGLVSDDLLEETLITVALDGMGPFTTTLRAQGLDGAPRARFYWFTELPETSPDVALALTVTLVLPDGVTDADPINNTFVLNVPVGSRADLPPPEPEARWAVTETVGVRLHYLTGTGAEADLPILLGESLAAYETISARLGESEEPVDIYLLDRVIGQGGYASPQWVAISYPSRRYSPIELRTVLLHELTHRLDGAIGCGRAPSLMREGLAVYLAGGHYRPEPLRLKAAALLDTLHYIPLDELVVDFYTHQHEVGYLQAAGVIEYVVETRGWESLVEACEATAQAEGDDAARWNAALTAIGIESSGTLEEGWWQWLQESRQPGFAGGTSYDSALLELELRLMEAMRRYQAAYDPSAHFLEGILFSPAEGRRLGIVADFVRRPRDPVPIGFELVLARGQEAVEQRDVAVLEALVEDLELALTRGPEASVYVQDAIDIAELALGEAWEPSRLLLLGSYRDAGALGASRRYLVYVIDRQAWTEQSVLTARRLTTGWELRPIPGVP
jgi:hypothetical protein